MVSWLGHQTGNEVVVVLICAIFISCNDFGQVVTLHYVRVIWSGLSTRLLNHYYTRCTELDIENSYEGNDREKR